MCPGGKVLFFSRCLLLRRLGVELVYSTNLNVYRSIAKSYFWLFLFRNYHEHNAKSTTVETQITHRIHAKFQSTRTEKLKAALGGA